MKEQNTKEKKPKLKEEEEWQMQRGLKKIFALGLRKLRCKKKQNTFSCRNTTIKEPIIRIRRMRYFKEIIIYLLVKIYGINLSFLKFFNSEEDNLGKKARVSILIWPTKILLIITQNTKLTKIFEWETSWNKLEIGGQIHFLRFIRNDVKMNYLNKMIHL